MGVNRTTELNGGLSFRAVYFERLVKAKSKLRKRDGGQETSKEKVLIRTVQAKDMGI